jgi:hypothetical protein
VLKTTGFGCIDESENVTDRSSVKSYSEKCVTADLIKWITDFVNPIDYFPKSRPINMAILMAHLVCLLMSNKMSY